MRKQVYLTEGEALAAFKADYGNDDATDEELIDDFYDELRTQGSLYYLDYEDL